MTTAATEPIVRPRPGVAIWMIAVFQLLVAILTLWLFFRVFNMPVTNQDSARGSEIILDVLLATALLEIITAIGLLFLRSWARYLTLFLATVPLCITTAALIHHKPHPWDFDLTFLQIGVALLIPISLWWWIVFMLPSVRAKFHPTM